MDNQIVAYAYNGVLLSDIKKCTVNYAHNSTTKSQTTHADIRQIT